jgi:hypothetical protein
MHISTASFFICVHYLYFMKRSLLITVLLATALNVFAQEEQKPLVIEGYAELYYGFDFNTPSDNNRPGFVVNHHRHNEVNVNLAMLRAIYNKDRVRASIGVMAGTYANVNLVGEPGVLKNIYEANAGFRLHKRRDLWVDAGIFPSHIGQESVIGMDNATLTRSMIAEGSPYYEAGVRLSYTSLNDKFYIALMHLNGWQRIQRRHGNSTPAGGLQITRRPNKNVTFNLSTFVGNDFPDTIKRMRYFIDMYTTLKFAKRFEFTASIDLGMQEAAFTSSTYKYDEWLGTSLILRFQSTKRTAWVLREERFYDPYSVILTPDAATPGPGFNVWAITLGHDRWLTNNLLWRIEGKLYVSEDPIFRRGNALYNDNYLATTSLAVRFNNRKNH